MVQCQACGKQTDLPFRCTYCGKQFCSEHLLPKSHNCLYLLKEAPTYIRENRGATFETIKSQQYSDQTNYGHKNAKSYGRILITALAAVVLISALLVLLFNYNQFSFGTSPNLSPTNNPSGFLPTSSPSQSSNPASNGDSHENLVNYALSLINSDRQDYGLQNVTLSNINSGQFHAEEMLKNDFFSHWDMNGYKPYMRYTLAGGKGAVTENCAWKWSSGSITDIKAAIKTLEHDMMYDDASSNWGHRDNILEPSHNKVSIGIAYDSNNVYLVQDFEDDYVEWTTLTSSNGSVSMRGTITQPNLNISQVGIYYDKVSTLTTQQLSNAPYQASYDPGTYAGQVLPPLPEGSYYTPPDEGTLITASSWSQTGQNFDVTYDLSSFFTQSGAGVYTLYLWTDSNTYLTSYSIWNSV